MLNDARRRILIGLFWERLSDENNTRKAQLERLQFAYAHTPASEREEVHALRAEIMEAENKVLSQTDMQDRFKEFGVHLERRGCLSCPSVSVDGSAAGCLCRKVPDVLKHIMETLDELEAGL